MADEGFHEIQLNRKQLIFLFMSAAVVLVVAFLSGVLVGRGVGTQGAPEGMAAAVSLPAEAAPEEPATAVAPGPAPAVAPPQPLDEDLSYQARLEGREAPQESLKPVPKEKPAALPPPPPPPAKAAAGAPPAKATAQPPPDAKGTGWLVQVLALRGKSSAEAAAKRLVGKGYSAFVVPPGPKGSRMYRVVVGRFKSRQEAEEVKRRLEKDKYTPWIIS